MTTLYPIGFGTLQATLRYQQTPEQIFALFDVLLERAISSRQRVLIDTARVYGPPEMNSEKLLGLYLKAKPEARKHFFIVVKIGIQFNAKQPYLLDRRSLLNQFDDSLRNLGLSFVDSVLLHRLDPSGKNLEEAVQTLIDIRDSNRCESLGLSEVSLKNLQRVLRFPGMRVNFLEIAYSPFVRRIERNGIFDLAKEQGICLLTYTSVLRGLLSDRIFELIERKSLSRDEILHHLNIHPFEATVGFLAEDIIRTNLQIAANYLTWCYQHKLNPHQVALAYSVAKDCIPIPGTTSVVNLKTNLNAAYLDLSEEDLREIDDITENFRGDPNPGLLDYLNDSTM